MCTIKEKKALSLNTNKFNKSYIFSVRWRNKPAFVKRDIKERCTSQLDCGQEEGKKKSSPEN